MSYIGTPFVDNTNLFTGTLTTTGTGAAIDVTGFETALIQVNQTSGSIYRGIIIFERSLDGTTWYNALVTELNSMSQKTQIDSLGIFAVRSEAQYLRYNITNITGSVDLIIDGGTAIVSPVDKISWAMDEVNNSPLHIKVQPQNSGIKQDLSGAFILSDAPEPVTVAQVIGGVRIIDTTGYQTIHLTTNATFAATGGVQFSNDGVIFTQSVMMTAAGAFTNVFVANTNYTIPVVGRFARITATTAGFFTYYLRRIPSQIAGQNLAAVAGVAVSAATAQLGMNIVQVSGTATVSGGLSGTLGVGGSTAVGIAPTSNPIIAGGIDPAGLGRRFLSDSTGRQFLNPFTLSTAIPSSIAGIVLTTTVGGSLPPVSLTGFDNKVPLGVQDTSNFEGQSRNELLAQILQEMKIMNQQLYELPRILAEALQGPTQAQAGTAPIQLGDEPAQMRNDASLFNNQQ